MGDCHRTSESSFGLRLLSFEVLNSYCHEKVRLFIRSLDHGAGETRTALGSIKDKLVEDSPDPPKTLCNRRTSL